MQPRSATVLEHFVRVRVRILDPRNFVRHVGGPERTAFCSVASPVVSASAIGGPFRAKSRGRRAATGASGAAGK